MPAYRFKAKARTWRERHHAESIENRHAKGVLERRVEYRPDQDGMAWLSAYLPADQAAAGWNRLTALSRANQGPNEHRTMPQLRADTFSAALLTAGTSISSAPETPPPVPAVQAQARLRLRAGVRLQVQKRNLDHPRGSGRRS
jgi:hypothetical protein